MASSSSSLFEVHPNCPEHLKKLVTEIVRFIKPSYLEEPVHGELFDTKEACLARLQGYALSKGFVVVTLQSKAIDAQFRCIYHAKQPRNTHKLEDHVVLDKEGVILSKRQRENTKFAGLGCTWKMYWSIKFVNKKGFGIKAS